MKIKYGKGECFIEYTKEEISTIVIKYKGLISLRHNFMGVDSILDDERALLKNVNRNNLLIEGNNQIHIGFLNNPQNLNKLFDYNGEFKIQSAKVNDKNIPIELFGVDYYNLINSNWDNAGKPEKYNGTYTFGKIPRKKRLRGRNIKRNIKRLSKGSTGGY